MWLVFPALAVLAGFVRDGNSPKLCSLEVQGSVSQPLLGFVEVWDLFLRQHCLLCPKCQTRIGIGVT